jgi:glycosyltransferase involved in cell wall biosynthesis
MTGSSELELLLEQQRRAARIEPGIGPLDLPGLLAASTPLRGGPRAVLAQRLWALQPEPPRRLLLLPALQLGGAERVAANAAQAVAERLGSSDTLILATDRLDRRAAHWFEPYGTVAVLPELADGELDREEMALLLAQLINWWQPRAVFNSNSWAGWRALERFGRALSRRTAWSVGLYCRDRGANGLPLGHADRFLRACLPWLERVLCDHQHFLHQLEANFALPPSDVAKLCTLYQPVQQPLMAWEPSVAAGQRVLWAGRLCDQKRPQLLAAVARLRPQLHFEVYGPSVAPERWAAWGLDRPNIHACGPYARFADLPHGRYGAMLFTSAFEGLPNVLLEAGAIGLPIVASAVGGVPELITEVTGWPVPVEVDEAQNLALCLDRALGERAEAQRRSQQLRALLQRRHSADAYWRSASAASSFFRS